MADAGGHWNNLAEAQKLTQGTLVPGIIEEDISEGGLIGRLPVMQVPGQEIIYNRENDLPVAARAGRGSTFQWQDATTYSQITRELSTGYIQTPLDQFVESQYGNFNNYAAIQAIEDRKALMKLVENDLVYGNDDSTVGDVLQPKGLHQLAALYPQANAGSQESNTNSLNIDEGEAGLQLSNLRALEDSMQHGIDFWLFPYEIARRLDAHVQENAITTSTFGQISFGINEVGQRVSFWNGVPIVRSRYLVAEEANTGVDTTTLRAKQSTTANNFSVFAIKMGQVARREPGLSLGFGNSGQQGEFFKTVFFPNLEDFDASGLRNVAYYNLVDGSTMSIGRIYDIIDAAVVA